MMKTTSSTAPAAQLTGPEMAGNVEFNRAAKAHAPAKIKVAGTPIVATDNTVAKVPATTAAIRISESRVRRS
jgi:hypothetical protein